MKKMKAMDKLSGAQILVVLMLLSTICISCIDRIDLQAPAGLSESVVIQGKLLKGNPSTAEVRVSRLFDFDGTEQLVTINKIVIEDEDGNSKELIKRQEGVYDITIPEDDPELSIEVGKGYRASITLVNREVIESTFEVIKEVSAINDLDFELATRSFENEDGVVNIDVVNFKLNSDVPTDQDVKLLWDVERTFRFTDYEGISKTCYVNSSVDLTNIKLLDPESLDQVGGEFEQVIYQADIDFTFAEGYYLTVKQESVSPEAFEYFRNVSSVIDRSGNMFESPAGKIRSNLTNLTNDQEEVFGYFYVAEQAIERLYISVEAAGNPDTICLQPVSVPPPSGCLLPIAECCDCLTFSNSSTLRPAFWTE